MYDLTPALAYEVHHLSNIFLEIPVEDGWRILGTEGWFFDGNVERRISAAFDLCVQHVETFAVDVNVGPNSAAFE